MSTARTRPIPVPTMPVGAPSEVLSTEEAAEYLRIGQRAVRKLWQTGHLPGVSLNQKHLVFRLATLDAFLARLESDPEAQQVIRDSHAASDHDPADTTGEPAPTPAAARTRKPPVHTPTAAQRGRPRRQVLPDLGKYEGAAHA